MPSLPSSLFFLCLLVYIQLIYPAGARRRAAQADHAIQPTVSHWIHYLVRIATAFSQAGVGLIIASLSQLPVFGSKYLDLRTALFAVGFLALNMALIDPVEWKYTSEEIRVKIVGFLPHTAPERLIWIAVSLAIAVSEEIIYRAVFFGLLYHLIGIYWVAGAISAILFSISHRGYGPIAVGSTFFAGLGLQWFVQLTGGLYVSIGVHFIHNSFALVYRLRGKQESEAEDSAAEEKEAAMPRPSE